MVGVPSPVPTALLNVPLTQWTRSFRELRSTPDVMASPPTLTIGANNAVSTITGLAGNNPTVTASDTRLTYTSPGSVTSGFWAAATNFRGARIRFFTTARRFEVRLRSFGGRGISVYVDGQLVSKDPVSAGTARPWSALANSGDQLALYDFGADNGGANPFYAADFTIGAGGSGYAVNDIITLSGGTFATAATIKVLAVSGGAITAATVAFPGSYTALPSNNVAQGSTTGSGTGATFAMNWSNYHDTVKPRRIEIVLNNSVQFGGLNLDNNVQLRPWPVVGPKLLFAGDSFTDYPVTDYAAGNYSEQLAWRLGLHDAYQRVAVGGRGYIAGSPLSTDLAAIIAQAPDIILIPLGVNDDIGSVNTATLQATVTSNLNTLLAALPNVRIVVVTAWIDANGRSAFIIAGAQAASDQSRVATINFGALNAYALGTRLISNDGLHPIQTGHDHLGLVTAQPVVDALLTLGLP